MMTIKGFPFNVDHETNYVTYAGNVGGVPENWHVEYCKGEAQPRTSEDLGLVSGWNAEYFFFPGQAPTSDGYDILGKSPQFTCVETKIDFPNAQSWIGGNHPATFPSTNYYSKFFGQLRIIRGGEYLFQTTSDDGSRMWIDDDIVIDNWGFHGRRRREKLIEISEGWHNIKVEHFQGGGGSNLDVRYKGDDTDDIEISIEEHIYHGKDNSPVVVNAPETTHSSESNPGGSNTQNINLNSIQGASPHPVVAPFLQGTLSAGSGLVSPTWTGRQ
jgi:hypothetical protein